MPKIVLVSTEKIAKKMAGPAIRYFELAKALSKHLEVTLLSPGFDGDIAAEKFDIQSFNPASQDQDIFLIARKADYLLTQSFRPRLVHKLKQIGVRYIADLYDPTIIEILEHLKNRSAAEQRKSFDLERQRILCQIYFADHILCASERQRDFYFGLMSSLGLINPKFYATSPKPDSLISIVPFGLSQEEPEYKNKNAIYEKFQNIKPTDHIIYWGGGIWDWFDPLSVVKAIEIIATKRQDIKLVFPATKHPNPEIKQVKAASETIQYAKNHNLKDKFVFFNEGWTSYEDRADYLLAATLGISTHFDTIETHFAFRTRLLDYLWANLPMVVTKGDALADLVKAANLGEVVGFGDATEIAQAVTKIVDDEALRQKMKTNILNIKSKFFWDNVVKDLVAKIDNDLILNKKVGRLANTHLLKFYSAVLKNKF